uniref:Phospholipase C-beta C-terminal domain-containing protein n=1 Tax=Plectus sambesii TaxID=2011161 RepID=A0A914XMG0_9BILA
MGGTFSPLPSSNRSTPSLPTTPVPPNGRSPSGIKGNISRPNIPGFDKVLDADSPRSNSPALTTRPKLSTPTGPGRCLLETYDLNYPTIETLSADRKIDKLRRKHEHDAELLKDRHNKERQQLVKRHQRKIAELEGGGASSQNVGVGLLANVLIRRAKRINRPGESSTITPRRPSAGDSSSLQASHDSELKQLHSKHWKEELQMLQDFENVLKSTMISLSDQSHKTCLRTLDIIFDKEVNELMKQNQASRKTEVAEAMRTISNKEDLLQQKRDIEDRNIKATVEQRRAINEIRQKRMEEVEKIFDALSTAIESEHSEVRRDFFHRRRC